MLNSRKDISLQANYTKQSIFFTNNCLQFRMRIPIFILCIFAALTVLATGLWGEISGFILPNTTWGLYSKSFFENVLVEAHGTIVDLFVVGVILYWFERRHNITEEIARHEEILSDLRLYRAPDSSYRILGTVRRLLALGVKQLHLSELNLSGLEIEQIELINSNLHATIFTNSHLRNVTFDKCNCEAVIFAGAKLEHTHFKNSSFRRAKFQDAILKGIDFTSCQIEDANFTNANLRSATFRGVDCRGVDFKNADLRAANFLGALNLNPQMLRSAKCIKSLKSNDPNIVALVNSVS